MQVERLDWLKALSTLKQILVGPYALRDRNESELRIALLLRGPLNQSAEGTRRLREIATQSGHASYGEANLLLSVEASADRDTNAELDGLSRVANAAPLSSEGMSALLQMRVLAKRLGNERLLGDATTQLESSIAQLKERGGEASLIALSFESRLAEERGDIPLAVESLRAIAAVKRHLFDGSNPADMVASHMNKRLKRLEELLAQKKGKT